MTRRYRVQIQATDGSLERNRWTWQTAATPRQAAIRYAARRGKADRLPFAVFVALPAPTPENGAPMVCHGFQFARSKESTTR